MEDTPDRDEEVLVGPELESRSEISSILEEVKTFSVVYRFEQFAQILVPSVILVFSISAWKTMTALRLQNSFPYLCSG